jgi:hypothetical protein
MGCDIHMFAEIKKKWARQGVPTEWKTVGSVFKQPYNESNKASYLEFYSKHRGWVDAHEYEVFKEKGKPESWCGGVDGSSVQHVTNEEMDKLITNPEVLLNANIPVKDMPSYYTQVQWEESYRSSVASFLDETVPALKELLNWEDVEDVRIVFFFDN